MEWDGGGEGQNEICRRVREDGSGEEKGGLVEVSGRGGEGQRKGVASGEGGPGFLRGLQRLREEMYLE